MDWQRWHDRYDAPESPLAWRLRAVQDRIRTALDAAPPGPLRVISLCAGQGRDLLGVLPAHPRREDVRARLVELDPGNVAEARRAATALGLPGVETVAADAALLDHCADLVPADLVLLCGVFGNITNEDIERTVEACTQLCAPGARVIWTRHRKAPDQVPRICGWFESRGFVREWTSSADADHVQSVTVHRFTATPAPLRPGTRVFDFVGYDRLHALEP
ncbi:class I SAM-dependent methyltransferase [Streptomyces sp. 351MFTsu5.1]|uniref:class I SAM-dependent methyltransferase n=1 Tax=Streptomyces sp. 351MFTsu5.1 TaxID=1172180 RepID=UPI0003624704|nr:class I SAM-dependent methyltransferase [Streptomyces sp. 351MFTsu5.1]